MGKPRRFEKPVGVRDYLPDTVWKLRTVEQRVSSLFHRWGYEEVITPTLEYYDTVGGLSSILDNRLFKMLDKDGQTLVLRPDMTTPIARVVASVLRSEPFPIRLSYRADIFRAQDNEASRSAEFKEIGAELIGDGSPDGDGEMLALAVAGLKECHVSPFKLAVGHVGFLHAFLKERVNDETVRDKLKDRLCARDYVGYREIVGQLPCTPDCQRELIDLLTWRGGEGVLSKLAAVCRSGEEKAAVRHLSALWEALAVYGVTPFVMFDLGLLGKMHYYTGIYFEGYAGNHGFPLLSGGRYDNLLAQFGRSAPAVGFSLKLDRVLDVSSIKGKRQPHILIVYDPSERREALHLAAKWRRKRHRVTTQMWTQLSSGLTKELRERYDNVLELRRDGNGH